MTDEADPNAYLRGTFCAFLPSDMEKAAEMTALRKRLAAENVKIEADNKLDAANCDKLIAAFEKIRNITSSDDVRASLDQSITMTKRIKENSQLPLHDLSKIDEFLATPHGYQVGVMPLHLIGRVPPGGWKQ